MPIPADLQAQLTAKRAAEHREASRDTLRDLFMSCLQVAFWCALGVSLVLYSFHIQGVALGRVFFWTGLGAGNGGMLFSILAAYRRGEKRGDW